MNIGLKSASGFQSGWVRWGETDGHQCCRSSRSFGNQAKNQTVALLCSGKKGAPSELRFRVSEVKLLL
ncbi:hypothetical protein AV530_014492 [Patagioenas fasciata monilis]|uniref:Uncharacterized protein n=1 Tax=Patagioenas fasciata monilis TaxID=372326 RepID=A0A1V4KCA5_PATFA|nr:hypothetical protein AV530_014492 [Patagioenas fasciata monilis]